MSSIKKSEVGEGDDIFGYCSDEEEYKKVFVDELNNAPEPSLVISSYERLSKNEVLELNWKFPGRRKIEDPQKAPPLIPTTLPKKDASLNKIGDFDFDEPEMNLGLRRTDKIGGPKGGAKKKTTSLAGILSNMQRHRALEKQNELPPSPK